MDSAFVAEMEAMLAADRAAQDKATALAVTLLVEVLSGLEQPRAIRAMADASVRWLGISVGGDLLPIMGATLVADLGKALGQELVAHQVAMRFGLAPSNEGAPEKPA